MLVLADAKVREDYFSQQANFVSQEGRKDDHAEYATNIHFQDFKPKILVRKGCSKSRWSAKSFSVHLFWFVTLFGLTVPYRIWFSRHCDEVRVTLIKEISSSTSQSSPLNLRPWMASRQTSSSSEPAQLDVRREQFRKVMRELDLYPEQQMKDEVGAGNETAVDDGSPSTQTPD